MTYKNTKTILFASLIVAMILPFSGMTMAEARHNITNTEAHGENLGIGQLLDIIETSGLRIAHYEARLSSAEELFDHRIDSIIAHQELVDRIDALVNSGVQLTNQQIVSYDDSVAEINSLEWKNVLIASKISSFYSGIARHQAAIAWAQGVIDSRENPIAGDNPELAPSIPEIELVLGADELIAVNSNIEYEPIDPTFEKYPTVVLELSTNGTNWNFGDDDVTQVGNVSQLQAHSLENYVEYLVRLYAYNEYGTSSYSLIWSGIPTEYSENARVAIDDVTTTSVEISWDSVPTFTHLPLHWIVERSVNYGAFTEITQILAVENVGEDYIDNGVVTGNIYSYRVTMVTDFETQTRSGFASVLIP